MRHHRCFTLLETLLAAALLAMVVGACVPVLTPGPPLPTLRADPALALVAISTPPLAPPNTAIARTESRVAGEIRGVWVTVVNADGFAIVWRPEQPWARGSPP